jgi:NADH-quinone oxidoreductase subunit M
LTLRALEAHFGRLSLAEFHGLYEQVPALAVCFVMTGLASVGFRGTLGFVSAELLVAAGTRLAGQPGSPCDPGARQWGDTCSVTAPAWPDFSQGE